MRTSILALVAVLSFHFGPTQAQEWTPDPSVQASLHEGGQEILELMQQRQSLQKTGVLEPSVIDAIKANVNEIEVRMNRHLEYEVDAYQQAADLGRELLTRAEKGVAFGDLLGGWRYLGGDVPDGCTDIDGQYKVTLTADEGKLILDDWDGYCELKNQKVVDGKIVFSGTCTAEGEAYNGDVTLDLLTEDVLQITAPIYSRSISVQACPGTVVVSSSESDSEQAISTPVPNGMTIEEIGPYFAVYLIARECAKSAVAFTAQDMTNLDEFMKGISDASTAARADKERMWGVMTGALSSQRLTEEQCFGTREQLMFMVPPGTLVGAAEAFPF